MDPSAQTTTGPIVFPHFQNGKGPVPIARAKTCLTEAMLISLGSNHSQPRIFILRHTRAGF
jgi:hypothetical protein